MISEEQLQRHYNKKYSTSNYKTVKPVQINGYPKDRFEAAVYCGREGGDSFLEVGPGNGGVLLTLKNHYKRCVGVEFSEARAKELKKLFSGRDDISILVGNIEDKLLNFQKESFDTILMNAVIEHLICPIATVQYLMSLLRPSGRLIIITPNIAKYTRRIKLLFGYFPSTASLDEGLLMYDKKSSTDIHDEGHLHYFTYRALKKILIERAGASKVEMYGFGHPGFLTRFFPALFSDCLVVGVK